MVLLERKLKQLLGKREINLAPQAHLADLYLHKRHVYPGKRSKLKNWEQALLDHSDLCLYSTA